MQYNGFFLVILVGLPFNKCSTYSIIPDYSY